MRRESRVRDSPIMRYGTQEITWEWVGTTATAPLHTSLRTAYAQHAVQSVDKRYSDIFAPRAFKQ